MLWLLTWCLVFAVCEQGSKPFLEWLFKSMPTFLGPMMGGVMRSDQSCCVKMSLSLLPIPLLLLAGGFGAQFIPVPRGALGDALRMTAWIIGCLVWFAMACLSALHAYS